MKVFQCIVTLTVIAGLLEEAHTFVKFKPPRLYPDTEEIIISSGDSINLLCEGNRPINWSIPKYTMEHNEEELAHLSINFTKILDSEYPFVSHLEVRNTYYMDTGYYYCHYDQEMKDLEAVEEVAKLYVYVNDTKDLLVHNTSLGFVMHLQYETAIIPCKPTSPDIDVELYKDGELVNTTVDGHSVEYDPKRGYILGNANFNDGVIYSCNGSRGEISQETRFQLHILPQTVKVAKPKIEEEGFRHVVLGMNVRLECTVQVEIGIIFNMEWKTPNPYGLESERVLVGNATSSKVTHNTIEYRVGSRDLYINNVTHDDEGYYECIVTDHSKNTNKDKKFLNVFERNTYYINFTVQGSKDIVANAGDDKAQWVVTVAAHPAPKLIWYNPHGKEITSSSSKYEVKNESTSAVLKISNIVVSDNGTYQLRGFNYGVETIENLTLTVHDKPAVEIDELSNKMFYMHKQKHKIKCDVVGYPTPNITWYFRSCGKYPSCDDHETVFEKKYYEEVVMEDRGSKSSILEIEALDSGYLTCFACNEVGCENETVNFFVTDVENGFNAEVLPAVPIEEDNVRLSCGASVFNYTNWITWKKYSPEINDYVLIDSSLGYKVVTSQTNYSYQVEVQINNITKDYSGNYSCTVHKTDHDTDTVAVTVEVLGIQKPIFLDNNMSGSDYPVSASNGAIFICNVTGVPIPDIRWFKDGERYDVPRDNKTIKFSEDRRILSIKYVSVEDEGKYVCKATNKAGVVVGSRILTLTDKRIGSLGLWIGLALGTTFFCLVILYLIWNNRKEQRLRKELMYAGIGNFEEGALESINPELGVDDQAELLPYDKKWEFPREKLKLGKQLGSGAFGVVMKASAYGIVEGEAMTTVAVKMVKRNAEYTHIKALASELKIMVHLGKHLNVVNLLGACTKNLTKRELLVIVEYCRFGNLQNYLLRHREDFINQIDPVTGRVDPLRGNDMDCAASMFKGQEAGQSEPRIKYAALSFSTSANSQESQGSVQDYRAAPVVKMENTTCSSGRQMLQSDMTFDSTLPSGDECGVTGGSCSGPEWRTNYRGDYGGRDVRPICTSDLICWAFQVARGIDYLASRKVLHGDLAARNILLAEDNIVKICDFGLAKSMYKSDNYKKKGDGPLPVKWMAIESIRDRVFSTQSDVWSFGIVLWEFFSLARTPYPGMEADERLYNKLVAGYRMEKPQYATDEVYSTMLDCWKAKPIDRPTFAELTDTLGGMLEDTVKRHYIDLNSPYMTMNDQQRESTDYLGMMSEPSYANAIRGGTPQRDYVNAPCNPRDSPTQYLTMASPTPTIGEGDEPGYLCMQGGSPGSGVAPSVIFSPRPHPPLSFTFDVPSPRTPSKLSPRIRPVETKGAEGPELSPMLPDVCRAKNDSPTQGTNPPLPPLRKEDSVDSGMGSPNSYFNPTYRSLHKTNGHMPPSMEVNESGYINIPQSKEVSAKARESDRSSGFQSEVEEGSPVAIKNSPSYNVPPQIAT